MQINILWGSNNEIKTIFMGISIISGISINFDSFLSDKTCKRASVSD